MANQSTRGHKAHLHQVIQSWVAVKTITPQEGQQAKVLISRARTREEQRQVMDALRFAAGGFKHQATDFAARLLDEDLFAED